MITFTIFIIDDEQSIRQGISYGLKKIYNTECFSSAEDAIKAMEKNTPDLVLLDVGLPGMDGIAALRIIREKYPDVLVVMITAYENNETVITAMKYGAKDYLIKPIHMESLKACLSKVLETVKLKKEIRGLQERYIKENIPCFVGESDAIQDVIQIVEKVAQSVDTPIMITGESGTGKELIASAIHYNSPNFQGTLATLNCAAIPKDLIESELFGYEKGAFTGAAKGGKEGLIEQAADGTLFLDEVGDLSLEAQAKLLRFLEDGEYYRVGGTRKHHVQARVVSATNKDLNSMIQHGLFRLDLYYRLAVIRIEIPSLNDRREDILPIAKHFLVEFSNKHNKPFTAISDNAEDYLKNFQWTGNIRELRNLIERGVLVGDGPDLLLRDISDIGGIMGLATLPRIIPNGALPPLPDEGIDLEELEEHFIREAFKKAKGNDTKAAQLLKMNYYSYRYRRKKIKGLER
ncbi:MAG: sigma-54 dependent transcriptional regulator [Desulfobacterales bacterium]|nr:sigma-54 dependent transcriptional regulator [Desulfobacterales bacterium]